VKCWAQWTRRVAMGKSAAACYIPGIFPIVKRKDEGKWGDCRAQRASQPCHSLGEGRWVRDRHGTYKGSRNVR